MSGERSWLDRRGIEVTLAVSFLTRLPTRRLENLAGVRIADCIWVFPIVGLMAGACAALIFGIASDWLASPRIAALLAIAFTIFFTGALHEDGLADFADGIGGGRTRERKLEIMRDSRIGTYGALALLVSVLLRVESLATLNWFPAAGALMAVHCVSRALMALPFLLLSPARADGLSQAAGRPGWLPVAFAGVLAILVLAQLVPGGLAYSPIAGFDQLPACGPVIVGAAGLAAALVICVIARRYLGGHTGDVFGAAQQAAEVVMLVAISAVVRASLST